MLRRMEFKTIAYDTKEGFENEDRIYQLGYLLYEVETNRGKFSDGEHHFKDLPYFVGANDSEKPSEDGWNKDTEYHLGDMVRDENDNFFISVAKLNKNNPLSDKDYWRQITNDNLVNMKYVETDEDAKICLTTLHTCHCNCDDDCDCHCNKGKDSIKLSKKFSPTVNLKTGLLKVPGGIEVDGYSFEELVERIRILEEKIAELENREEGN